MPGHIATMSPTGTGEQEKRLEEKEEKRVEEDKEKKLGEQEEEEELRRGGSR